MTALEGLRVLVVEDEAPIAMLIEDMVQDMGCVVAGFAATVPEALKQVKNGGFDFALLDMNLGGAKVDAVADALAAAGTAFAFASGYGRGGLAGHLQDRPVVQKPFLTADLEKAIRQSLGAARAPASPAAG
ncbi:MAG TPA: response regulator [Rhizomicrobium sp.]|jgi:CheY-like chemotaxis protein|nr:response regulator [Rhizomicrobium sp.]